MTTVRRLIEFFIPTHYSLSLTIDREARTFSGTVTIEGTPTQQDFYVHTKDLTITSCVVNGRNANYTLEENDELHIQPATAILDSSTVVLEFSGVITDQMHGMYPCYFNHNGKKKELLATQFESHHAREVFPCIDEPEAKATFDVTLTTERDVTVLGNMPVSSQTTQENLLVTSFDTTPRMSTYLLAWVVGELHSKTANTKSGVEVNIWATPAQSPASLDFALDIATRTIDFFDEYFGVPYPLPKADHVALPDFSSGAMENWGLITYREVALLADPATTSISSKRYIATVVAHELSHQWFGNLVTMKWWNNLWLNESFANLMEYIAVDALHPEWDIWLEYSSHETIMALRRDAIDGVQAVQTEVNHPDEISTLFDGAIVYAKGGRLLRMLQHYIGHDAFREGLRSYFKKYAYQNTEGDDLWAELSSASGKDITQFMNAWISQPGYPVVHIEETGIRQEQFFVGEHEPSTALWPIPLEASSEIEQPLLDTKLSNVQLLPGDRLNVGDTAHFVTHYPTDHLASIIDLLKADKLTPLDRLQLLHEQTMLARGSVISSAELIPLIVAYKEETAESVWDIIGLTIGELKKFVESNSDAESHLRELSRSIAENEYQRLGWNQKDGEAETDTRLRATILGLTLYGEDKEAITAAHELYNEGLSALNPELRSLLISNEVRHFETPELIDSLIHEYQTTASSDLQMDICSGLTSTKNPATIEKLLLIMKDSSIVRSQDAFRWFVYLIRNREAREASWKWLQESWDWVEKTYGGDKSFDDFPRYAAAGLATRAQLDEYKAFFTPMMEIPALTRVIQLGIAEIEARVDIIEKDSAAVNDALAAL